MEAVDENTKRKIEDNSQPSKKQKTSVDLVKIEVAVWKTNDYDITLRSATTSDITKICKLVTDVLLEYKIFKDREHCRGTFEDIKHLSEEYLESGFFIVLEDNISNEIIGTLGFKKNKKKNIVELKRLYLAKNFRGKSLGRKLMQIGIDKCKELWKEEQKELKIILRVYKVHSEAISLYKQFGFSDPSFQLSKSAPKSELFLELCI